MLSWPAHKLAMSRKSKDGMLMHQRVRINHLPYLDAWDIHKGGTVHFGATSLQ